MYTAESILFATTTRPALRPTQSPSQGVGGQWPQGH